MRNFAGLVPQACNSLETSYSFRIYSSVAPLPDSWDDVAAENIFLTAEYLSILERSSPENMECRFIGIFANDALVGTSVSQFINMSDVASFGERDNQLKTKIRHLFFKTFTSNVLILGNNMFTGQNAFVFVNELPQKEGMRQLHRAIESISSDLRSRGRSPHLTIFKDFSPPTATFFELPEFKPYYKFSTQPNMVLTFRAEWNTFDDYVATLTKKYRDQFKRARNKSASVIKRKIKIDEIEALQHDLHKLYMNVARKAPFNTFYLPHGHFYQMKMQLKDKFLLYGYFEDEKLIGFSTLIKNGADIDTYFLGYDEDCQREKMLYLNMLYDMIGYSINKGFRKIVLARTALEIKSSVGAVPEKMIGYIAHSNPLFNYFLPRLFHYFEPELKWQQRHPFK